MNRIDSPVPSDRKRVNQRSFVTFSSLLILLVSLAASLAAAPERPLLINGHVATNAPELQRSPRAGELFLIRDTSGKLNARRMDIEAKAAVRIHAYLPPDAFLASVATTTNEEEARASAERLTSWIAGESGRYRLTAFDPSWKIDAKVHLDLDARLSMAVADTDPPPSAIVTILGTGSRSELVAALAQLGVVPWSSYDASVPAVGIVDDAAQLHDLLPRLTSMQEVLSIELAGTTRLSNDYVNLIVQTGSDQLVEPLRPIWDHWITGEGEVVAIYDTGADFDHCMLREEDNSFPPEVIGYGPVTPDYSRRKIVSYSHVYDTLKEMPTVTSYDQANHGTAIAGLIAGAPLDGEIFSETHSGLAPDAKLVIQDLLTYDWESTQCIPGFEGCPQFEEFEYVVEQAYTQGARIHSNSWVNYFSIADGDHYTLSSMIVDEFSYEHRDMLFTCGVGNGGMLYLVASPASAKNIIGVGASGTPLMSDHTPNTNASYDDVVPYSSRGPSGSLNQIKPDLMAPGQTSSALTDMDVLTQNCGARIVAGTSFSGPVVAASAALLRDYLKQGFYPSGSANMDDAITSPSAALLKATLIAGASDLTGVDAFAPNFDEGWGRVNLDRTLAFGEATEDPRRLILIDEPVLFDSVADATFRFGLEVLPSDAPGLETRTRIMLVWSDPPASPMAETTYMVNDLDLVVIDVDSGDVYAGNAFDAETGLSAVNGAADEYNNVEGVFLDSPQSGPDVQPRRFVVEVHPRRIIEGPQTFAIAVSGHVQQFTLPTSGVMTR